VFVGGASFHFWRVLGGAFGALEEFSRALEELRGFGGHLEFGGAQVLDWSSLEVFRSIGCACVHIPAL
jgi:hypothetical protein